jgi:hypothetical protein
MKILNLDKIAPQPTRSMVIGGVKHPILPMTVENFVLTTATVQELSTTNATYVDQVNSTIEMILRSVPTLTHELLNSRALEELNTIATFVRGEDVDGQEEEVDGEGK